MVTSHADRTDPDTGTTERFAFFGQNTARIAGTTHIPAGEVVGAVLVVPGILQDLMRNYRTDVLLSRTLADRGVAVQRFQYRGTGNSDGEPSDLSFDSMTADIATAADHLEQATGVAPTVLVAARMGAMVAARSAPSLGHPALTLFEPVLDGARYYREGFRARMVSTVTEAGKDRTTSADIIQELRSNGVTDMVGFTLPASLYDTTSELTLGPFLDECKGRTLLVQLNEESATPLRRFMEGRDLEHVELDVGRGWWFIEDGRVADDERAARDAATNSVADWIIEAL